MYPPVLRLLPTYNSSKIPTGSLPMGLKRVVGVRKQKQRVKRSQYIRPRTAPYKIISSDRAGGEGGGNFPKRLLTAYFVVANSGVATQFIRAYRSSAKVAVFPHERIAGPPFPLLLEPSPTSSFSADVLGTKALHVYFRRNIPQYKKKFFVICNPSVFRRRGGWWGAICRRRVLDDDDGVASVSALFNLDANQTPRASSRTSTTSFWHPGHWQIPKGVGTNCTYVRKYDATPRAGSIPPKADWRVYVYVWRPGIAEMMYWLLRLSCWLRQHRICRGIGVKNGFEILY